MKSEKEFLESMWTAIDQEQSDIRQEQMVLERTRKERIRKVIIGIGVFCLIVAFACTKIFSVSIPEGIVYASSFLIIIIAFVVEKLSFKEVNNGN